MSAGINLEETACYFFSETFDFHHDFHGECEDCGRIVPEWLLLQCQYGFCGKFSCTRCGFRCRKCGDDDPRSVSLCSSHALLIYPVCDGCKKQFCDVCSQVSVAQCKSCLKHYCTKCQTHANENISKSGTCDQCDIKVLRTLQEICRSNIRRAIRGAIGTTVTANHEPQSRDIDRNVEHLPLPTPVKDFVCYK
ncbi:PREDICTED: uncharacterized protein LOC107333876 [Acropora digitifera]|uniref:uncharacterized protein LOC107333876 n=1 Tax=Acropora digitifera TaxID=70779 RepID=UPI000779F5F1|nr:PREDICTED: uncharacterized protein LOC107333876 [Acropora digitifera]